MTDPTLADERLEAALDALEDGNPSTALDLVAKLDPEDPVVAFVLGLGLLETGQSRDAIPHIERAVAADPEDLEFRTSLALAQFRALDFPAAQATLDAIDDDGLAGKHFVQGLLADWAADFTAADEAFARAREIDPELYRPVVRLSDDEFKSAIDNAQEQLPERFRKPLDEVAIQVEPLPSVELLKAEEPWFEPEILGLFVGPTLGERGGTNNAGGMDDVPRILLFQRNLEREVPDRLEEEIAITLYHELGHYLGLDEEELEDIGLG